MELAIAGGLFLLFLICCLLYLILAQLNATIDQVRLLTSYVYKTLGATVHFSPIDKNLADMKKKQIDINDKLRNIQNILSLDRAERKGFVPDEDY